MIKTLDEYEKAKVWIEVNAIDVDWLQLGKYRKELLEYRRQHKIFEVGDKVVEITDYPSNDVLTVKSIFDKLLVCESDDFNASYVLSNKYKPYFYVRRATDEEIEAGKRLEVV
ncbi:hypothetical protein [Acinetobacter radioresistens]|uniref:hypothetical protein n=1 Tax=Acinetobacter radioresistens TaxID=40216 RepID=UPI000C32F36D|nr:hypothetical protein [Acinetobacter radioresistens]PKD80212.1 hypothetical protein CW313_13550 [Acinetobacter radioresistens]